MCISWKRRKCCWRTLVKDIFSFKIKHIVAKQQTFSGLAMFYFRTKSYCFVTKSNMIFFSPLNICILMALLTIFTKIYYQTKFKNKLNWVFTLACILSDIISDLWPRRRWWCRWPRWQTFQTQMLSGSWRVPGDSSGWKGAIWSRPPWCTCCERAAGGMENREYEPTFNPKAWWMTRASGRVVGYQRCQRFSAADGSGLNDTHSQSAWQIYWSTSISWHSDRSFDTHKHTWQWSQTEFLFTGELRTNAVTSTKL